MVESNEVSKLNVESYTAKMDEISRQAESQRPEYQAVVGTGHGLVSKKDVTDTAITKEKVKVSLRHACCCSQPTALRYGCIVMLCSLCC